MKLIKKTLLAVVLIQLLILLLIQVLNREIPKEVKQNNLNKKYINRIVISTIDEFIKEEKVTTISKPKKKIETPIETKVKTTIHKDIKKSSFKKIYTVRSKIEIYAKKLLGKRYVWGATGPKTFDCSGFTQKVYRSCANIFLPRVSREQAKVGKYIEYGGLKQGDMVFFDTSKEYKGIVNHVGIYLNNGKFIHASSGGKRVMITNFNKKRFYKNRFLWGRRVINDNDSLASLRKKEPREKS